MIEDFAADKLIISFLAKVFIILPVKSQRCFKLSLFGLSLFHICALKTESNWGLEEKMRQTLKYIQSEVE